MDNAYCLKLTARHDASEDMLKKPDSNKVFSSSINVLVLARCC